MLGIEARVWKDMGSWGMNHGITPRGPTSKVWGPDAQWGWLDVMPVDECGGTW